MIIDIGSGHKPYKDADILLEHRRSNNKDRWGQSLNIDRPTVLYDGLIMPFKNKSFEFSISRHVLEHVDSPKSFLNEIERISKAGYIETPSEIAESLFTPFDKHKWIVNLNEDTLLIRKKTKANISRFGKLFDYLCDNEKKFNDFFYWKRRKLFFVEYFWKKKINFKIVKSSENIYHDLNNAKSLYKLTRLNAIPHNLKIENIKSRQDRLVSFKFLERHFLTPCCKANVRYTKSHFICTNCSYKYSIIGQKVEMFTH